ncbi:aldehyde dehydrogenase (NADP(+)) [Cryobacterium lactosi]|uniref:Aldehyde dehydrogenase (NADP(+)) n=1 Tax=Cryobacterium lactosi TaxID=1259202 RepID=A0A4R9BVL8_9MICO|nr:aldehyde dehydrogenase (NADP(+)) [Cryobacterium lactosi]TFD90636.1 aldehyde dehydrogenase (NADP(+)) [Cryobacterium lactosi]
MSTTTTAPTTTTVPDLTALTTAAARAARILARSSAETRAGWLEAIADSLDAHRDELVAIADTETHLGVPRLTGEVGRTTGQLRLFARVLRDGGYLEATIDHANPASTPPAPDLRRLLVPLGPVAVFSASNFPFAFSVAGGDTASALAVGCPVIVKAHSGHIRLSHRTAELVTAALREAGAPDGSFALIEGRQAGIALVQDPRITAVSFTGSVAGGRALFDLASARPEPIPFYGELGSINPVVITAAAAAARGGDLATGLAGSFTLGAGQFCTKPGVVFVPAGAGFEAALVTAVGDRAPQSMLTDRITDAFRAGISTLGEHTGVEVLLSPDTGTGTDAPAGARPAVIATTAAAVIADPRTLLEEVFGPTTLLVRYAGAAELDEALRLLPGSLTATLHAVPGDDTELIVERLAHRAGRVLFAGWPTGVAVNWAQQHGGPWPATTTPHTSVGATAVRRFLRPLAFQDAPESSLPAALHDANPLGIPRRVDGVLEL